MSKLVSYTANTHMQHRRNTKGEQVREKQNNKVKNRTPQLHGQIMDKKKSGKNE